MMVKLTRRDKFICIVHFNNKAIQSDYIKYTASKSNRCHKKTLITLM